MNVCFVTSECVPYVKTGGLADVSGALPKALAGLGCRVKLFLPRYDIIDLDERFTRVDALTDLPVNVGARTAPFGIWRGRLPGADVEVYLVDCPHYFHRGSAYTDDADEHERFILLQHAVLRVLQQERWAPDVIHCNDWQTGLLPVYLRRNYAWDRLFEDTATLFTIHNLRYQGRFDRSALYAAGLSTDDFYPGGPFEFYGAFSFMKAGLVFADAVSTVSPTYAGEIQRPEYGEGLDGVLRTRRDALYGILNGVDTDVWNPATDALIPQTYDRCTLEGKRCNKKALLEAFGLPTDGDAPLVGIISRMVHQKGLDLLQPVFEKIMDRSPLRFAVLGSGEPDLEQFFKWARSAYPDRVGVRIGYDDPLSHLIEAGSDLFLIPSRYEPCGLNQMYSLAYGTVPVVRRTGGLADTVRDVDAPGGDGNGFAFDDGTPEALFDTLVRAADAYRDRAAWQELQRRGMAADFSWAASARAYRALYDRLRNA